MKVITTKNQAQNIDMWRIPFNIAGWYP